QTAAATIKAMTPSHIKSRLSIDDYLCLKDNESICTGHSCKGRNPSNRYSPSREWYLGLAMK
ncbi:MAG: hypothetical protein ACE5FD_08535, partial [Anaerolineae bacterium]